MLSDEVKQLLDSVASISPKGANIKLESDVLQAKRTPLTLEELKKIIAEGGLVPANKSLPSLTMQQYQQLPGGLTAYQNLTGFGQQEAIEGTANVNQPIDSFEEDDEEVIEVNCPSGYAYNPQTKQCEPIMSFQNEENDIDVDDQVEASYNSFANKIFGSEEFKGSNGTYQDFLDAANESYLGKHWNFFFNDDSMMNNAYYSGVYMDSKGVGSSSMDQSDPNVDDFDFNTGEMPSTTQYPVLGAGDPNDYTSYDTRPLIDNTSLTEGQTTDTNQPTGPVYSGQSVTQFDSSFKPKPATVTQQNVRDADAARQQEMDNREQEKADRESDAAADNKQENEQAFKDFQKDNPGGYEQGGFVEQAKPIQLDDVSLKMQEGGQVPIEGMPMDQSIPTEGMEGMPVPSGQPAGFVEDPMAAPAPDNPVDALMGEGQKDDVMGALPEGTFVINAMAVQLAGLDELDKMVEEAYESMIKNLREKGVEVPLITQLVERSKSVSKVDVAVSNGEYIIPPELVPIIGEDKLRKINDRGLKKLEETKKTREKEKPPVQMKEGGTLIDTDSSGKIATKQIGTPNRPKSLILTKESVAPNIPKKKTKKTTIATPFERKVSPDEIAEKFTGDIPLPPLDTTEKPASVSLSGIQRKVTPDEMASGFMKRLEDEGSKIAGPDTVIENTPAQIEGMKLSGPDLPTTDYTVRSEDPEELRDSAEYVNATRGKKRSFMRKRPTETGLQLGTGDPEPSNISLEYLKNLYAAYEKQVKDGNVEGLNTISEGGSIFASAPVSVKMEFSKLVKNDLAEIAAGNTYNNLKPDQKNTKESKLESNKESLINKFFKMIQKPFQKIDREPLPPIKKNDNEVIQPISEIQDDTDNQIDDYKYNDIKNTYEDFMKQSKGFKLPSLISTAQADEVQAASLYDPDYTIPRGLKLLPNKNLNVPEFLEVVYRLGESENASKEKFKDSYNGTSGGLFQLGFQYFAPKELIDKKNKQYNLNMKEEKLGKIPKTYRAKDIEEFYSPYYQRTMAMALLMDYLETYEGDPIKAIVAYNAGKTRADKLGPNNNFTDFERYVLANNPKDGKRIVRDAKRLVEKILPEQFNFPAKVVNMSTPEPKPKMRTGGFV